MPTEPEEPGATEPSGSHAIQTVAKAVTRCLSIDLVYGEPVSRGDATFIPVARVAYGFGAGEGGAGLRPSAAESPARGRPPGPSGSGGGGGAYMTPVGVVELRPEGARFVRYRPWAPLLAAAGLGLALGWVLGRARR